MTERRFQTDAQKGHGCRCVFLHEGWREDAGTPQVLITADVSGTEESRRRGLCGVEERASVIAESVQSVWG